MVYKRRFFLLLLLAFILVSSFLGVSFLNYKSAGRALSREITLSSLPLIRENIYSEMLKRLMPPISIASAMANDAFLVSWINNGEKDLDQITDYLERIKNRYGFFSAFYVSQKTGNYYYPDGILKKISRTDEHDVWYYSFADSGKIMDLDVDENEAADRKMTIFINERVIDDGDRFLGVAGVGLEMEDFSGFLSEKQYFYNRTIYLADSEGIIQAHSDEKLIGAGNLFSMPGLSDTASSLLKVIDGPVNEEYILNGERVFVTSLYMPEIDWFLIVEQGEDSFLGPARSSLMNTLLLGFLSSLVIIVLIYFAIDFYQGKIEYLAVTDELTGAYNRREFLNIFSKAENRYKRYGQLFSMIILDIDDFKLINDTCGHLAGDTVLVKMAETIKKNLRLDDVLIRFGGDEFVIIIECGLQAASQTAERILKTFTDESSEDRRLESMTCSASAGVAEYRQGDTLDSLAARADKALYLSKDRGKGLVAGFIPSETAAV